MVGNLSLKVKYTFKVFDQLNLIVRQIGHVIDQPKKNLH